MKKHTYLILAGTLLFVSFTNSEVQAAGKDWSIYAALNVEAKLVYRSRYTYTHSKKVGRLVCRQLTTRDFVTLSTTCKFSREAEQFDDLEIMKHLQVAEKNFEREMYTYYVKQVDRLYCEYVTILKVGGHAPVRAQCILNEREE